MPRLLYLISYDISCHLYSFDTHVPFYYCLFCLTWSNGVTLGVIGEDHDATAPEIAEVKEETPQQLAEWALEDVF